MGQWPSSCALSLLRPIPVSVLQTCPQCWGPIAAALRRNSWDTLQDVQLLIIPLAEQLVRSKPPNSPSKGWNQAAFCSNLEYWEDVAERKWVGDKQGFWGWSQWMTRQDPGVPGTYPLTHPHSLLWAEHSGLLGTLCVVCCQIRGSLGFSCGKVYQSLCFLSLNFES